MSTKSLETARRRIVEAERRIAEQRTRLAKLRESGDDVSDAEALLETFHDSLDAMLHHLAIEEAEAAAFAFRHDCSTNGTAIDDNR